MFKNTFHIKRQMASGSAILDIQRPLHISHRGGALNGPENTMPTFQRAVEEFKTDMLEFDVRSTSDGAIVVHHDSNVDRTSNGNGPIQSLSFKELEQLDAGFSFSPDGSNSYPCRGQGYKVPKLAEVLHSFPDKLFHIDVKQNEPAIEEEVMKLIREAGLAETTCIGSASGVVGRRIRRVADRLATFPSETGLRRLYISFRLKLLRWYPLADNVISIPQFDRGKEILTESFVRQLQSRGRKVFTFIVDDPEEQKRVFEMGVDGVMTDRPDVLRETMKEIQTDE